MDERVRIYEYFVEEEGGGERREEARVGETVVSNREVVMRNRHEDWVVGTVMLRWDRILFVISCLYHTLTIPPYPPGLS